MSNSSKEDNSNESDSQSDSSESNSYLKKDDEDLEKEM